jgi:hypothetical protein
MREALPPLPIDIPGVICVLRRVYYEYVEDLVEAAGVTSIKVGNDTRQNLSVSVAMFNQRGNAPHCRGSRIVILNENWAYPVPPGHATSASAYRCVTKETERWQVECLRQAPSN